MLTRRRFLQLGSMAGAGMLLPGQFSLGCGEEIRTAGTETTQTQPRVIKLPGEIDRFIDALPLMPVLTPDTERYNGHDYYEISLSQFQQELHSQLPPTPLWGYGGIYPGPVIETRSGRPVRVKWINEALPGVHILRQCIDPTIFHGRDFPEVRTVAHLHGGHTPPDADGLPEAWSTPGASATGAGYNPGDFIYPNQQQACMLWYHDHAMGITRLNIYAGLAGLYIIRDETEDALDLPRGDYEVPLLIQDRIVNPDGTLHYPTRGNSPAHPIWNAHFFGNTPVVNGKAYPFLEVEPRRYRLRLLNGSQSRFYNLWFQPAARTSATSSASVSVWTAADATPFHVIGSDGGLLPKPAEMSKVMISPAERVDLIIDFSGMAAGAVLTLMNDAPAPVPFGGAPAIDEIMQFRVSRPLLDSDETTPAAKLQLPPLPSLTATPGLPARQIVLFEQAVPATMENWVPDLGGSPRMGVTEFLINAKYYNDPVEEQPKAGTTEVWEIFNGTTDTHPIHLHLVQFQVLNRQTLRSEPFFNAWYAWTQGQGPRPSLSEYLIGEPMPPGPDESGWKDIVRTMPLEIARIIARFDLPPGTKTPARYVYHCHMLEHEDNEMMRPYEVV